MGRVYVGIDLGKKGGIVAVQNSKLITQCVMPLIAGEDLDLNAVSLMLERAGACGTPHVVFERFGGFFGYDKRAVVSLSRQSGLIEGLLFARGISSTGIIPRVWQKEMFAGVKELKKKAKEGERRDTKAMAAISASKLFPGHSFIPSPAHRVPHEGLIDAALLARYGERKGF